MVTIIMVCTTGGSFDIEDIYNMRHQLEQNITVKYKTLCYTNIPGVEDSILTTGDMKKYWGKVSIFENIGPCLYIDLDVVIIKNIDHLINSISELSADEFVMLDVITPREEQRGDFSSSVMGWNGDFSFIKEEFTKRDLGLRGDQTYITRKLLSHKYEISPVSELVHVYGWNTRCVFGIPEDAEILNFYATPRPRSLGVPYWGNHLFLEP